MNFVEDVGDRCVYCDHDTSPGSGRYVNRVPAEANPADKPDVLRVGYACAACLAPDPDEVCECFTCAVEGSSCEEFRRETGLCDDCAEAGHQVRAPGDAPTLTQLAAEVGHLRALLAKYGEHLVSCAQRHSYTFACTCGWKEARPAEDGSRPPETVDPATLDR